MQCKHIRASFKPTSVGAHRSSATAWADRLIIRRASPVSFAAPLKLCVATVTLLPDHSSGLWALCYSYTDCKHSSCLQQLTPT